MHLMRSWWNTLFTKISLNVTALTLTLLLVSCEPGQYLPTFLCKKRKYILLETLFSFVTHSSWAKNTFCSVILHSLFSSVSFMIKEEHSGAEYSYVDEQNSNNVYFKNHYRKHFFPYLHYYTINVSFFWYES